MSKTRAFRVLTPPLPCMHGMADCVNNCNTDVANRRHHIAYARPCVQPYWWSLLGLACALWPTVLTTVPGCIKGRQDTVHACGTHERQEHYLSDYIFCIRPNARRETEQGTRRKSRGRQHYDLLVFVFLKGFCGTVEG